MDLAKGDFVYIDALSNQLFMGSDENGFPTEPERDGVGNWHILGSLVATPKPRLKKLLTSWSLCEMRAPTRPWYADCHSGATSLANVAAMKPTWRTVVTRILARYWSRP